MSDLPPYWPSREDRRFAVPNADFEANLLDRAQSFAARAGSVAVAVARTAAMVHGVETLPPGFRTTAWPVEFTHRHGTGLDPSFGARLFRWELADDEISVVSGLLTTTPERTLVDCARILPRLEALAAADQLLRVGADRDRARSIAARRCWPTQQRRRITEILDLADRRSESPMESWCRCMIIDAGMPKIEPQVRVGLRGGGSAFLDLGFEEYRLGVEYDGLAHHSSGADIAHDRRRRSLIAQSGWALGVFQAPRVLADPAAMLWQVAGQLQTRGWRPPPERLERIRKRINFIAALRRREREVKFGAGTRAR
jgi:very-short-patch-repair endonuclease